MEKVSEKHRTTIAYFLNHGRWNEDVLEQSVKAEVIRRIYGEAERTGKPIYCMVDDTISSKTKPSSRALHPMEDAYFHQSHLKKKRDYGRQAVGIMLSCNGWTLNYAIVMYDKSRSKIQIVCDIAKELPEVPVPSFLLCDCWYSSVVWEDCLPGRAGRSADQESMTIAARVSVLRKPKAVRMRPHKFICI